MPVTRRQLLAATASLAPAAGAAAAPTPAAIEPFRLAVPDETLDWIRRRVVDVRMPTRSVGTGWAYGVDADWFDRLLAHWRTAYDWRAQERAIAALPQFVTGIDGRRLHFVHVRSANAAATPLLLLHGWPYSFWSFSRVVDALARDFHVVLPSLPGMAFSQPVADQPRGLRAMSRPIHELMTSRLGYERYWVQGSDHGAVVADWLALDRPASLLGIQANLIAFRHAGAEYGNGKTGLRHPTAAERRFVAEEQKTFKAESGYFALQSTRPETIAYGLTDSPVGMAAYLLDKWQKWTDLRGGTLEQVYGFDRLVTEVMLQLVSDAFATSLWPYAGFALEPFSLAGRTIDVPFGFSGYPDPLNAPPPREFAAHGRRRIVQWEVADRGGHFPFLEQPDRFVESFRRFVDRVGRAG